MLASSGGEPSIEGTIFADFDMSGDLTAGEELENVEVRLFLDDGDGIFSPGGGDFQVGLATTTDANGEYCFDNLDGTEQYFVFQPAQTVNGVALLDMVSTVIAPGAPDLLIDDFDNPGGAAQEVVADPVQTTDASTLFQADETHIIGQERDLFAEFISGMGEVELRADGFDSNLLQFATSGGVQGTIQVVWDGNDNDAGSIGLGLAGRDLTNGGVNEGLGMQLGVDPSGSTGSVDIVLRIYEGASTDFSEATASIPVTDGTATEYLFVPFSDFAGTVTPDNVDAIELLIDGTSSPSFDGEIAFIGALAPKASNFNNPAGSDLSVTKTNNESFVVPGTEVTYDILVQNLGPNDAVDAIFTDAFDTSILTNVTYTSTVETGTAGGNTSGSGDINDMLDLNVGAEIRYTVTGTVAADATGTLSNTATINVASGDVDPDPSNNSDTDTDPITPQVDLEVSKTNGVDIVADGDTVTYTIVVSNNGPSDAVGATISDNFPSELTGASVSTAISGTAAITTSNTTSTGISDIADIPVGSSITYTVTGTVNAGGSTDLSNTVQVQPATGVTDTDTSNNNATDDDPITEIDLSITKTNNVDSVVPGEAVTYVIVVSNSGQQDVTGATVEDTFTADLENITYTSTTTGTASGNTANGSGSISDTVDLTAGSTITYTVQATIVSSATGTLDNTATVTAPSGMFEAETSNNTATDSDPLIPEIDLQVSKTNNVDVVQDGDSISYSIVVENLGPSDVSGVTIEDTIPTSLTNVVVTTTPGSTVVTTSNTTVTEISDIVDMPAGSSISYLVEGTFADGGGTSLTNTVTATAPSGVTENDLTNNTATDDDPIERIDLQITKTNNVSEVIPGQQVIYDIVVTNASNIDLTNAIVADTFPSTLENVSYTSTSTGVVSGNTTSGSGSISDTVDMEAGATITYTVTGTVSSSATGTLDNTATVTADAGITENDTTNNSATDSDPLTPEIDLVIDKSVDVTAANPGDTVTYTIEVSNTGPSDATGANVTNIFSSEFSQVTYTSVATGGASGQTASGSGDIDDTVDIPVDGTIVYTVTAILSATAAAGQLDCTADVAASTSDTESDLTNNSDTVSITVTDDDTANLSITKQTLTTNVIAGEQVEYEIVVRNIGNVDVAQATVTDNFPADLQSISFTSQVTGTASGNTESGSGSISDTIDIAVDAEITYLVTGTLSSSATGTLDNTATVTAPSGVIDIDTQDNTSSVSDPIVQEADLAITKTNNEVTVISGAPVTYIVIVTNNGPTDVTGATVEDVFAADFENVTFTSVASGGASGNTASGSGNLSETVNLPSGSSIEYTIDADVIDNTDDDLVVNTATVSVPDGIVDTNPDNNSATDTDPVDAEEVDVRVTKTDNIQSVTQGDSVTYEIVVSNVGNIDVDDVDFIDTLPSELTNASFTSTASGGATGNTENGTGDISDNLNLPVGSEVTYTLTATVDPNVTGSLVNTASVNIPTGFADTNPDDNADTDTNTIRAIDAVLATISGFVYIDEDDDGIFGPEELPIEAVDIVLEQAGNEISRVSTDATGAYLFDDLDAGDYTVREVQPDLFDDGQETVGGPIGTVSGNDEFAVTLQEGENATELNFGESIRRISKRDLLASRFAN